MYKAVIIFLFITAAIYSQSTRGLINDGVEKYKDGKFSDAEVNFRKGIEKQSDNFEGNFNLGDAYYKQQKYDEAIKAFNSSLKFTDSKKQKGHVYHNIGNSLLKSNKIKESIEAYKNSLKLNPDDQDTKYNLSYALSLLNQQQNQQQNQQNKQDQNKDNKKDDQQKNNDQQNQNNDKNKENKQQQNKSPEDQKTQQDNLKQQQKDNISKEEAEQILNALKNNEKDLQKKLRKKTGVRVNTEKDW